MLGNDKLVPSYLYVEIFLFYNSILIICYLTNIYPYFNHLKLYTHIGTLVVVLERSKGKHTGRGQRGVGMKGVRVRW